MASVMLPPALSWLNLARVSEGETQCGAEGTRMRTECEKCEDGEGQEQGKTLLACMFAPQARADRCFPCSHHVTACQCLHNLCLLYIPHTYRVPGGAVSAPPQNAVVPGSTFTTGMPGLLQDMPPHASAVLQCTAVTQQLQDMCDMPTCKLVQGCHIAAVCRLGNGRLPAPSSLQHSAQRTYCKLADSCGLLQ